MAIQAEELYELVHRRPFQPFRLVTKSGRVFEVVHPGINAVLREYVQVGTPIFLGNDPEPYYDTMTRVDYDQIDRIEMIVTANGTAR